MGNAKQPELRFAGFDGDWEQRKLEDVTKLSSGKNLPSVQNGRFFNVTMGSVLPNGVLKVTDKTNSEVDSLSLGDLIMPTRDIGHGDVIGITAVIPDSGAYVAGNCTFVLHSPTVDSKFLSAQINTGSTRSEIIKRVSGSAQKMIKQSDILTLTIMVPSVEEQHKVSDFLSSLSATVALQQGKLESLQSLKQAFLQKLFV
ncbi:restriction endonuclease subunit S [Lacticaseibacillus nasuensis]|uniref:restriction endonuclease subunit S n=1 Tax=Lacticaseibacillus nasuensis TaxID=944671 RepID=UPI0022871D01|nr:restriction endonuclease subunit S [Lacticaseibacillus nasuensis]